MLPQNIPFLGWMALLSNGEMFREEPPIPNEKSSWQKLIDRLYAEDLKMVGLCIRHLNVTINALPPKSCQGYYQAREARFSMFGEPDVSSVKQGIGSVVGDKVYIAWVDGAGSVWTEVRDLEGEKIHTTLRDL